MEGERAPVLFVGVLPPPVNGMTLASAAVVERLGACCDLRTIAITHRRWHRGLVWRVLRGAMFLRAALRLRGSQPRPGEKLYLVANSRGGLVYDRLLVRIAKRRGWRIVMHHQVYSYLHEHDRRMAAIDAMLDAHDTHVCLCPEMIERFRTLYGSKARFIHLPNTMAMDPPRPRAREKNDDVVTLGHISNLAMEKGLDAVIQTHRVLREAGQRVDLVLAGPCQGARERALVEDASRRWPDSVRYLGPVYDGAKWDFFGGIDVLLFPTRYLSEAQPLVIAEALMSGVPVVAYDRACIAGLIGGTGGVCVSPADDFVEAAATVVTRFLSDPAALTTAKADALARGEQLRTNAKERMEAFCAAMAQGVMMEAT